MQKYNNERLVLENYENEFSYERNKSNLNITFNRIAFIFFVFLTVCVIYTIKVFYLGSLSSKIEIEKSFPAWRSKDRKVVTARDLLSHSSGLPAHVPLFRNHNGRDEFENAICSMPLVYRPRTQSIYSDLGFILLGLLLTDRVPDAQPLDLQFGCVAKDRNWGNICFRSPSCQ